MPKDRLTFWIVDQHSLQATLVKIGGTEIKEKYTKYPHPHKNMPKDRLPFWIVDKHLVEAMMVKIGGTEMKEKYTK